MNNLLKQMWTGMKDIGETIGSISFILGIMVLFAYFFTLVLQAYEPRVVYWVHRLVYFQSG